MPTLAIKWQVIALVYLYISFYSILTAALPVAIPRREVLLESSPVIQDDY